MLQPSQDKSKVLYDAVSKDYNIGTYDEFKTKLQSPEKRKAFYDGVGSEYSLGSYEEFEGKIVGQKKNLVATSTSNGPKLESVQTVGSSGGVKQNRALNALNTNNKIASSIPKSTSFRLPNDNDFKIMQLQGKVAPNSELKLKKVQNPDDLYNLKSDGTPVPKPKQKSITQTHWNDFNAKPFKVATIDSNNKTASTISKDVKFRLPDGYVQKPIADNPQQTEELYNFTEKHKATLRKEIDDKIEDNDLDLDYPYLYYSTFDKSPEINQNTQLLEEKPKDNFIERTFGEEKLKQLNINVADFDGFLNKKGYKNEFLDKEEKGLFNGAGTGKESYDISLAKEIQKKRLLSLYMGEINGRSLAKTKLEAEKRNLEVSGRNAEIIDDIEGTTSFDNDKFKEYIEAEMPNLAKKTKEVEVENKEIYAKHKSGEANLLYGTEKFFKKFGYGFLDKVNQITTTIYDKIGADERAQGLRFLNEERQISRPNTREVGYAKGLTTKSDGRDYLFTEDGRVIDQELKIDVTDLLEKYQYEGIKYSAKEEKKSDYTFSPQGSIMQFGGVAGDMIVQLALQKGVGGIASKATNLIPSLSKIPLSKGMSSSIISQSALGYTQGANETYKLAIDAGINEKEARLISNEAGQKIGLLYAITAPLSPQTKATQAIFGAEGKELIKKAILSYSKIGKKGFLETLQSGLSSLPRNAVNWIEEGLIKEFPQELIQQGAETYLINPTINNQAGQELKKETMSGEEVVNTLIQTVASGGLAVIPDLFSKTDKLKTLSDLSKDANFDSNLNNLVEKGVVTKEQANVLKKDVQVFSNQIGKIPKNLNKNIAMDVMTDLQEIQDLEAKKKTLDKSFHEDIDAEIETKRTLIKDRIKFDALSKKEITELKSTAKKELIQEAKDKDEDVSKIDNAQIVERANKIYSKQLKDAEAKTPTPEAQPQTEVPQQAEAEKVNDATSDAENEVVKLQQEIDSFNDEYNTLADAVNAENRTLNTPKSENEIKLNKLQDKLNALRDKRDKLKQKEETSPVEDVVAPKQPDNVIKVEPAQKVEIIDESLPKTDNSTDGKIPSLEEAEYKEFVNNNIVSNERLVDIADKVKKAEKLTPYENSIFHGKTSDINKIIADEKLSPTNTPTNGNVQLGASNVGESGNAKPKSNSKSSVPSSVDGGEVKGDIEVVKERINPKKEADKADKEEEKETAEKPKETQEGQKKQAFTTNSFNSENLNPEVKKKLKALGLNYDVENQSIAQKNAEQIIAELGIVDAYILAKGGQIRGGARTWIMAQMFEDLNNQINEASEKGDTDLVEYLSTELSNIIKTFANEKTLTGQETAMLNRIYNKFGIKYDLEFARENWKEKFGEEIPVEVEAKLKKAESDIKEYEKQVKELEERIGTLEEQDAMANLKNVVKRHNTNKPSPSSLKKAASALRQAKFTKTISDLSKLQSDSAGLIKAIWDGAIETIATALDAGSTIEQAIKKGVDEIKKSDWYKGLSKSSKIQAEKIAKTDFKKFIKDEVSIPASDVEQKAVKIPGDLIYSLVQSGIDNISDLTQAVHDVISKEYPNLTLREVRDAITGYGKQIEETEDTIKKEINRLKTDGKQMSALDDLAEGNRPKRSGRKAKEYTPEQRNRIKKIRELLKNLPIDDTADTAKFYKNAIENYKTRLENRIKDLNEALAKNERIVNERKNTVLDNDAKELVKKRDEAQKEYDERFGKPYKSDETLINEIVKRKEKSLRDLELQLESVKLEGKELTPKERRTVIAPKIDALNKKIDEKREELNDALEEVGIAESKRLERAKKYSSRRLKDLNEKLANGDFTKRKPKTYKYDKELIDLKRKIITAKTKWDIEFEKQEFKKLGYAEKLLEYVYKAFGTVKGLKATADFSAMLRQGVVLGSRNPKEYAKASVDMHKFAFDSKAYKDWMTELELSDDYINMVEDGLSITDTSGDVLKSEEQFVGNLLSKEIKVNGVDVNLLGRVTQGSERAYGGFLNSLRVSVYRKTAKQHELLGYNRQDHPKVFKNIAKFVNNATGRGVMTTDKRVAKALNILFFSPRMITGMVGTIKDMVRSDSTPYLRKQAATSLITFMGYQYAMKMLIGSALGLIGGDDDEEVTMDMNPVSTDFNKVRKGNKRYDVSSGYGIGVRTAARFILNKTSKGIGEENQSFDDMYEKNRYSEIGSFLTNKLSPLSSQIYKYGIGDHPTEFGKKKADATTLDYVGALVAPISMVDFIENIQEGTPEGQIFLDLLLNTYGVGVQSYEESSTENNSKGRSSRSGGRNR